MRLTVVAKGKGEWGQAGLKEPGAVGHRNQVLHQALSLLYPDTKAALLLLLTFLAKQHTDSFHTALGSLPDDKAQELQAMLGLT